MRKAILTGISLFASVIMLAQSGNRFPVTPASVWRVDHIRNGVSNEKNHLEGDEIYKYSIYGDTIIESKTYYKIFKTGTSYLDVPFYFENVYAGALRDENNKFFFVKKDETDELLLYNFNAKIDDTIQVPYFEIFEDKVVSAIDTLPDGRRIIHFNPKEPILGCGDQYIIEGIGGSGGLLEGPACFHAWTFDNHLVCYVQNGLLVYHDSNFELNCEIVNNQNIETTIDSTCVWRVDKQLITDTISDFEKIIYFVCGDTLIESVSYLKLCKTGIQLYIEEDGDYSSGINNSVYVGALRENNNKVYYIEKNKHAEVLLYNFNIQVGDIVEGLIFNEDTVNVIDTLLDNRKAFYLSDDPWQKFIIEGIGSDKGLLEAKTENSTLVCFMKNKASVYHNGTGTECNLTFDNMSSFDCDKMRILPANPTVNDEIKLASRFCYQVSYNNPVSPVLSNKILGTDENSFNLELYCDYDDRNNADSIKILYPLFDTVTIGYLNEGAYNISVYVHTIHHDGDLTDTSYYDRERYVTFTVSQSNNDKSNTIIERPYRVYPVPSKDYVIIEMLNARNAILSIDFYNLLGKKIETVNLPAKSKGNRFEIGIGNLNRGVYMIRINADKASFAEKIIVE